MGVVGSLLNIVAPRTFAFAFIIWLVSAMPVVVLRKVFMTCM